MLGEVGLMDVPTLTVPEYDLDPISVELENVCKTYETVPDVEFGSFA